VTQIIDALEHPVGQGSELAISSQAARGRVAKGDIGEIRECFNRSGREPGQLTRLVPAWGQPAITENEAPVEAVDLHVGHWTGIELGRDWTRVYLRAGSCGNTVSRRGRVLAQVADQADDVVGDEPPDGTA
jgi:hypothetical protein